MITVRVKGDPNTYSFPDGTPEEEIRGAMLKLPSSKEETGWLKETVASLSGINPLGGYAPPHVNPVLNERFNPNPNYEVPKSERVEYLPDEELGPERLRLRKEQEEEAKNVAIMESHGVTREGLPEFKDPQTFAGQISKMVNDPMQMLSMGTSMWPFPVGKAAQLVKRAAGAMKESALSRAYVPKAGKDLQAVIRDLGIAEREIKSGPLSFKKPELKFVEPGAAGVTEPLAPAAERLPVIKQADDWKSRWLTEAEKKLEVPPKTSLKLTPEPPAAPPEGQLPYAKPPHGFAPERPVAGKVEPPAAGLEYPRPEDMGWAEKAAVEGTPKPEKIVKGPLGDQSGQAALATEGVKPGFKNYDVIGPEDELVLYRGVKDPYLGPGGEAKLTNQRLTNDIEVARNNAGTNGVIYEVVIPARGARPAQEFFDPKLYGANLEAGKKSAAEFGSSAYPELSASLSGKLTEPQVIYSGQAKVRIMPRGETDKLVRPFSGKNPTEIDLGLTGNEPTGWSKRTLPHNASPTESLQKVAAIQDLNTGKVYTGPSHPAIISKNLEQLTPLIDAERAKPGWLVEGKFYESATKALNAMRGVSEEAAPAVKALGAAARDLEQTGQATARNAVHEMNNQAVSQAGKDVSQDLFLLDMGKDPNKKISKQFYDHVINNPERITETSLKLGMTEDELAAAMLNHASQAGKSLQVWSKFVKEMDIVNPKWGALLKDTVPPATWLDRVSGVPRRIIETWRAMLVTQMATSVRNVASQGARVGIDIIEIPLRKMLGEKDLAWTEGISQFANLFRFKTMATKMNEITALFPGLKKEYFSTYSSDLARMETPEGWLADKVNFLNKAQEMMFRRTVFYSGLEAEMASKGKNLSTMLSTGRALEIPVEALQRAGKRSLEYTFADTEPGLAFVRAINKIPGGVGHLFITYPRFMMNQLKFLHEYSPLGLTNLAGPQAKKEIRNGSQKTMARAIEGSMLLTGAYGIRAGFFGDIAGEKWYQLKRSDGSTYSIQPFNPLATYLWAGDVMNRAIKGTLRFDNVLDGWGALTGMRGINLLWGVEKMKNAAADLHDAAPGTEEYKAAKNYFKGVMGTFLGGFATPATTLRDFYSGFNDYITKDTNVAPLSGPATSRVPVLEETLPPSYAGTRESPRRTLLPVVRQLTGVSLSPKISDYESEISRFGFLRKDWLVSTSIPEFDNIVARETGRLAEDIINPFVESQEYKGMTEGEKEATLQSVMSKIRSAGFKMAATEDIDLYMRTLEKAPKHKRRLMEEILNSNDSPGEAQ